VDRVAAHHRVPFCHPVFHGVGEVREGGAEVLDLTLHGLCSPCLDLLAVGVADDDFGVEDLADHFHLALAQDLLEHATHLFLVLLVPTS
jgi:hypothetical protein